MARKFPKEFERTIPERGIVLVLTCVGISHFYRPLLILLFQIISCLEEYMCGYRIKAKFEGKQYADVYESMLALLEDIKQNPYHRQKFDDNRKRWAKAGM
jgi:Domain of unknown function (DUF6532)